MHSLHCGHTGCCQSVDTEVCLTNQTEHHHNFVPLPHTWTLCNLLHTHSGIQWHHPAHKCQNSDKADLNTSQLAHYTGSLCIQDYIHKQVHQQSLLYSCHLHSAYDHMGSQSLHLYCHHPQM